MIDLYFLRLFVKIKKQPNMSNHSSWVKYGRRIDWHKVLTSDEIKLMPALSKIAGYDEREGKFYPQESHQGLIDFVTAHPEFDLVTYMDNGSTVYGLCRVNRDMYGIALRGKAGRTQWLGE
jgi:hypothetical protein